MFLFAFGTMKLIWKILENVKLEAPVPESFG